MPPHKVCASAEHRPLLLEELDYLKIARRFILLV
jgi:hypothetical protein